MELQDLKPKPSKFYLEKKDKEYTLRPWTLEDQIWAKHTFENVEKIFSKENIDIEAVSRMVYRVIEDKSDFVAEEGIEIDEEGNEVQKKIGGFKKLIAMISGIGEQAAMVGALVECIGVSMPAVEELKGMGSKKKNQPQAQR